MKIPRENGAWPHFIIQTIIYTAKGGLDKSSPYNKSNSHKIWKNGDKKMGPGTILPFYGAWPHFIDRKYLCGLDIPHDFS
jgi:hypothetical protein